ncbi:hypothetical protein GE061_018518 [Apolygus lucorum]|uniref:Beta-glucuronidase n=1 Tax=Apolygus lucorum TaxID=248454 RepID=A0A8S9XE62_APOLU|nr:hypothetical protein GE061_018518 [Apolygus lucorum]
MFLPIARIVVFLALLQISSTLQRVSLSLDGIWKFKISPDNQPDVGFSEEWWNKDFSQDDAVDMPVPSSYNDVTTDPAIRDFVGWAWYQRHLYIPDFMRHWKGIIVFHFGSAQYYTQAWVNNVEIGTHEGGHIPFEFVMPGGFERLNLDKIRITVAINNTLNSHTIPQGSLTFQEDEDHFKYKTYTHDFDYFDYSGLNGGVRLIFKPSAHIDDVIIHNITVDLLSLNDDGTTPNSANIWWSPQLYQPSLLEDPRVHYVVKDSFGKVVVTSESPLESVTFTVLTVLENPQFWWPRSTFADDFHPGLLYELEVTLRDGNVEVDRLSKTFGIRTILTNGKNLIMNGKQLYLKGFGMHQDAEIRGRGFDQVQLVRDINLLKWTGANAIRTSHYPYSEEFLEMADRHGIMVILETPACSLSNFDDTLLKRHKEVLAEMWSAFKNHPSVIMWSLANEPQSNNGNSTRYFKELVDYIKSLDPSRPVTFVTSQSIKNEKAIQSVDVVCVNRYQGWYSLGGRLDLVQHHVSQEIQEWSDSYNKPVILTEYGAEALSGYHSLPSTMWTENYQIELFHEHFKAFDSLLQKLSLSGEMVWNFADFKVPQEYFRAEYCNKGIFTRDRQPKSAAYTIKKRYEALLLGEKFPNKLTKGNSSFFFQLLADNRQGALLTQRRDVFQDNFNMRMPHFITAVFLIFTMKGYMVEFGAGKQIVAHKVTHEEYESKIATFLRQIIGTVQHSTHEIILPSGIENQGSGNEIVKFISENIPSSNQQTLRMLVTGASQVTVFLVGENGEEVELGTESLADGHEWVGVHLDNHPSKEMVLRISCGSGCQISDPKLNLFSNVPVHRSTRTLTGHVYCPPNATSFETQCCIETTSVDLRTVKGLPENMEGPSWIQFTYCLQFGSCLFGYNYATEHALIRHYVARTPSFNLPNIEDDSSCLPTKLDSISILVVSEGEETLEIKNLEDAIAHSCACF